MDILRQQEEAYLQSETNELNAHDGESLGPATESEDTGDTVESTRSEPPF